MYVCNKPQLKLKDRVALKGDPVPEAAEWSESVLRAHLRNGDILKLHPQAEASEKKEAGDSTKGNEQTKKRK